MLSYNDIVSTCQSNSVMTGGTDGRTGLLYISGFNYYSLKHDHAKKYSGVSFNYYKSDRVIITKGLFIIIKHCTAFVG